MKESEKRPGFATRAIHSGEGPDPVTGAHNTPIYQTSTFAFTSLEQKQQVQSGEREGFSYTRHGNPTTARLEMKVADLEGAEAALAGASGMAVISALFYSLLKSGDHVVAGDDLYTWANVWLSEEASNYGIEVTRVSITDLDEVSGAIRSNTKLLYCELMSNPTITVAEVPALARITRENGLVLAVDNTFASPYLFRPLEHGADLSLHSATKYLGGHGDALAGIISGSKELIAPIKRQTEVLGSCISPFNSWLLLRGIKTLDMRMERHCDNAMQLARFLAQHPDVAHVNYAGLEDHPGHDVASRLLNGRYGGMLSFSMRSEPDARDLFADSLELCYHAVSLGDVSTLVWPHRDGLVRVSVGCENIEDIIADFEQAFARVGVRAARPAD